MKANPNNLKSKDYLKSVNNTKNSRMINKEKSSDPEGIKEGVIYHHFKDDLEGDGDHFQSTDDNLGTGNIRPEDIENKAD